MNCDDFLESLESPDERLRTAARWHANACPECRALADVQAQLKEELGALDPLSPRLRAVWEAAAIDESTLARRASEGRVSTRQLPMQLVSLAAALLLFVAVAIPISPKPRDIVNEPGNGAAPTTDVVVIKKIDASAELTDLLAQVTALEAELTKTSKQADLVDVRRAANVLLATYNHW